MFLDQCDATFSQHNIFQDSLIWLVFDMTLLFYQATAICGKHTCLLLAMSQNSGLI